MKNDVISLFPDRPDVTLTTYLPFTQDQSSDAILICPGGGYDFVSFDREGESIAIAFAAMGFRTFVLNYSVKKEAKYPRPLVEASFAMYHIKSHAKEYGVNPDRVFVMGFSAGGHLAASLGTLWHKVWKEEGLNMPEGANRPCGMVLAYPVLCYFENTHLGTFANAVGTEELTEENTAHVSLEKQVGEDTVPAFLWHTADDGGVHVENSLRMASSLCKQGVYTEMHIYPHGSHGLALADAITCHEYGVEDPHIAKWPRLAAHWMRSVKE